MSEWRSKFADEEVIEGGPILAGSDQAAAPLPLSERCPDCQGPLYLHPRGIVCACFACLHDFLYQGGRVVRRNVVEA